MSYTEMKNTILHEYRRSILSWYRIVGEFFEKTDGFTKRYETDYTFKDVFNGVENKVIRIAWEDYSWSVEEIN